jgi:BolA protein
MSDALMNEMRARLSVLNPVALHIVDDSHHHVGHAGAAGGGGHYQVQIVSEAFRNQPSLARHRMVYAALAPLMQQRIHALVINASAP